MFRTNKPFALLNSKTSNLHKITTDEVAKLHHVLLEMYDDLFEFCEKRGLKLIAIGGTAIGVVRHEGFIPWDDDIDLALSRGDYEILKAEFDDELSVKYDLLAPGYYKGSNCFLMRIMKKGTTLLNMIDEKAPYPHGIYVDITPLDYVPKNKIIRTFKAFYADFLRIVSYSVYWWQYKSDSMREYMLSSDGKTYYRARMAIGRMFSFRKAEVWFKRFDDFIKGNETEQITIAAGTKRYKGETIEKSVFFPVKTSLFENRKIYVPYDIDAYLTQRYGDYMTIPEEKDREQHLCLKLDFDN